MKTAISFIIPIIVLIIFTTLYFKNQSKETYTFTGPMTIMTDQDLSQVIGQSGLILSDRLGIEFPEVMNGAKFYILLGEQFASLNSSDDAMKLYITLIDLMNDKEIDNFTKQLISNFLYNSVELIKNASNLCGLKMEIRGYNVTITGDIKITNIRR